MLQRITRQQNYCFSCVVYHFQTVYGVRSVDILVMSSRLLNKMVLNSILVLAFINFYRPQTKFAKVMFYRCLSVHSGGMHGCQGACMVARGCVVARGHVWLRGVVHGCQGACMVAGGHVWLLGGAWLPGACMAKGVCVVKGAWQRGACMAKGACVVKGGHAW